MTYLSIYYDNVQSHLVATINPETKLKVAWLRSQNKIIVSKKDKILTTIVTLPNLSAAAFIDYCCKVSKGKL
ncbi:MAG: hypothetical protein NT004_13155 [Bacteroidetes bacterium]|nr:hypothetical protein [Bacteroidota bacterium]